MNVIGRTMRGGIIVEVEQCEYVALLEAGHTLALLPAVNSEVVLTHAPTVDPKQPEAMTVDKKKGEGKASRVCAYCKKPLPKDASPLTKTHKGECKKQYGRDYARKHWREKSRKSARTKAAPAAEVPSTLNPADPTLTDEQRKAARLEVIRRAAEKYN